LDLRFGDKTAPSGVVAARPIPIFNRVQRARIQSVRLIDRLMESGVDLRQIDCFLALATDLHFGKAAERLALAQSSVSEAIRSLEQEVGGQLFVRTSRRVQLTPFGEKLRLGVEPAALVLRATPRAEIYPPGPGTKHRTVRSPFTK
jgi:DNA-binding MarR family transcriptional regulator